MIKNFNEQSLKDWLYDHDLGEGGRDGKEFVVEIKTKPSPSTKSKLTIMSNALFVTKQFGLFYNFEKELQNTGS